MTQSIQSIFDSIAPTYDLLNHLLSLNADKRWRRKTVEAIPFPKEAPLRVLDLCAGTLDLSLLILKEYPQAQVSAVDFSPAMLDLGRKKMNGTDRLELICADALSLPFGHSEFDVVVCGYGFRNLPDRERGLAEIHRVLKRGGSVLILDFFKPTQWGPRIFLETYGQYVLPLVGGFVSRSRDAYGYLRDSIRTFYSTNECINLFNKQGFININKKDYLMGVSSLVMGEKG